MTFSRAQGILLVKLLKLLKKGDVDMRIRERRKEKGLTQTQLAELVNVDQTAISQWERGITQPRMKKCLKLAAVLGCTLNDLLDINEISMEKRA